MAVNYDQLVRLRSENVPYRYEERDTLLYALSIGMARDPLNVAELPFVYETERLRVVPTQAIVVARQRLIWDVGLNITRLLNGEQTLTFHRPLPTAADLLADAWVESVHDKGAAKGLVIQLRGIVREATNDEPLFGWGQTIFARGDGGIGGSAAKAPLPHPIPSRPADLLAVAETRPDQALLYRLTGDRNLVHIDPDFARAAGFDRPILHGACTYGIACRAVLARVCGYDPARMRSFDARFTSPVFPGEQLETEIWVDETLVSFRCRVPDRNVVVLDHGRCELTEAPAAFSQGETS